MRIAISAIFGSSSYELGEIDADFWRGETMPPNPGPAQAVQLILEDLGQFRDELIAFLGLIPKGDEG